MNNDALKFARWMDENRGNKYATAEEAYLQYAQIHGDRSKLDKFISDLGEGGAVMSTTDSNDELSLEILQKAMTSPNGEFMFLAYAPGPDGSASMDMGVHNKGMLAEILTTYALTLNRPKDVDDFIKIVGGILITGASAIVREQHKRAKNN